MNWLDYLILIMSCAFELYLCHDFLSAFFLKRKLIKNTVSQYWLFFVFVLLMYSVNRIGSGNLNLWMIPLILLAYTFINFKPKIIQGVMCLIFVISILTGCEYLFVILGEITNEDNGLKLSTMPWLTFGVKLLSFIILLITKHFLANHTKQKLTNRVFWMYLCLPIASLGMMFTTYFITKEMAGEPHMKLALTLSFAFMLFGNMIVFAAFNKYAEDMYHAMQQDWIISKEKMNKQYYQKIADMNDKQQELIHNLRHYITAVKSFILTDETDEALDMLGELNDELESNERIVYSKIPFLDYILTEKKSYAEDMNVDFHIYVEPGVRFGKIKKADYIVMLGNLLDNAIQAAAHCKSAFYVDVKIFMEDSGTFLVSKISNSFDRNNLIVRDDEFITTKKEAGVHGIGIKSVRKMAERCGGTFITTIEGDDFIAILALPK